MHNLQCRESAPLTLRRHGRRYRYSTPVPSRGYVTTQACSCEFTNFPDLSHRSYACPMRTAQSQLGLLSLIHI